MATRKLPSTRQLLTDFHDHEIYEAMARAMFVDDWARRQEENGRQFPPRTELMDVAPRTSEDALNAARALAAAIIKDNNVKTLSDLYRKAIAAGGKGDSGKFGHYLAMEAMGHGVSWYDDGNPRFGMKLPHFEYYSGRGRAAQKLGHSTGKSGYDGWNWSIAEDDFKILAKVEKHPGTRFGALASNLVMERRVESLLADGRLTRGLESVSRLAGPKLFLTAAGSAFLADYRARLEEIATPAHKRTNKEGLTFEEWLNAARVPTGGASLGTAMSNQKLIRAWKAGEDPTEYRAGYSSGDSTEQLRARIAKALKWTVKETESFSFPQLASFVRGKDAQLDADLARHIESASHWFKPARRSRRKGHAYGVSRQPMQVSRFSTGGFVIHKALEGRTSAWFDKNGKLLEVEHRDAAGRTTNRISRSDRERLEALGRIHAAKGLASGTKGDVKALVAQANNGKTRQLRDSAKRQLKAAGITLVRGQYGSKIGLVPAGHASGTRGSGAKWPKGPASGFGKEKTREDILARIKWETRAAAEQRRLGHEAHAGGHDTTRFEYEEMLRRKGYASGTKTKAKKSRMKAKASCSCTATVTRRKASKKSKKPATKK